MEKDLTLLVLAAGMGSRFGGLKQIEPVGPNGEFIIDYSIYDAIKAGFKRVVFVIKEENYEIFKETIGKRIEKYIEVDYAFQKNSLVPQDVKIPVDRIKPLGTAHALYVAKDKIKGNFLTINADDLYGRDSFIKAAEFLNNCEPNEYANVSYEVLNTLTKSGEVKRGVIYESNGYLDKIIESSIKEEENGEIVARPLDESEAFTIPKDMPVSMNLFCLTPQIFTYLEKNISAFFQSNDCLTCEWLLPNVAFMSALENGKKIKVLKTTSRHLGMTYREDLEDLKKSIKEEIKKGNYQENLWSE